MHPKTHLYGGSLLYTLLIALIIGTLIGAYIMVNSYQRVLLDKQWGEQRAANNAESGMMLFCANNNQPGTSITESLFGEESRDSVRIASEYWGMLALVQAEGVHGRHHQSRQALLGQAPTGLMRTSLFLKDQNQPLIVAGNAYLAGPLMLPATGIKTGIVGRRMYARKKKHEGRQSSSRGKALRFRPLGWEGVRDSLRKAVFRSDNGRRYRVRDLNIEQAWDTIPFRLETDGSFELDGISLQGKTLIIAAGEIQVNEDAELDHCLLFARRIRIEPGFEGRLQAFATESIEVGKEATLNYPSVLCLASNSPQQATRMVLHQGALIEGSVIVDPGLFGTKPNRNDYTLLADSSEVRGHVIVRNNVDIRGRVKGVVHTENFKLITPASIYNNYLLDGYIDAGDLHEAYVMPLLTSERKYEILEWLP